MLENLQDFEHFDHIDEALTLKERVAKFKKIEESNDIKFGVIVVTYQRRDGTTPTILQEAINSIKYQTYQNFKIYLIGDDYEEPSELNPIIESVDPSQIYYENMSLPGERLRLKGNNLWLSGSNAGANIAIEKALKEGVTHMVRLDHDDVWTPNHLEILAKGITRYPDAQLLSTTALIKRYKRAKDNYTRPALTEIRNISYNNISRVSEFWHSAICWNLKTFEWLRYRNVREQKLTSPIRVETAGGDRDLLQRMKDYMVEKEMKWINIPIITLLYRNKLGELPTLNE